MNTSRKWTMGLVLVALCSAALAYAYSYGPAVTVSYQGTLDQNGTPVTGTRNLTFFVVRTEMAPAASAIWTETHTNVPIVSGRFTVELGSVTAFPAGMFASNTLYLGVSVAGTELQARQRFTQVPYAVESAGVPPGTVVAFAGATPPPGWLLCDGHSVTPAQFPRLYDVIGGTYGGDATSFNLPDLRARFPLGNDVMGGVPSGRASYSESSVLGGARGEETTADLPSHTHSVDPGGSHSHALRAACNGMCANSSDGMARANGGIDSATFTTLATGNHTHNLQPAGTGARANNMPPYVTLNYIIKY